MTKAFEWAEQLPTLTAARVVLRPLVASDLSEVFAICSDPQVVRYWDSPLMVTLANASAYLIEIDAGFRDRLLFQWGIADRTSDRIIGTCTLIHVNTIHRRAEIGFALGQPHWGKGLATEAVTALIAFAFDQLGLHRLEADTDPRNERSLRLLERLGFRREGYLRERYHANAEIQDAVVLGLLRSEWKLPSSEREAFPRRI